MVYVKAHEAIPSFINTRAFFTQHLLPFRSSSAASLSPPHLNLFYIYDADDDF